MGPTIRLGIDVACRADHQASCANGAGDFLWSGWRFRTTTQDLEGLWAKVPDGAEVTVVLEPTRNAWVPLAAWLRSRGAKVDVPPEQSADLRDYYNKHTKTDRLDSRILARLPLRHPDGLRAIDHLGPAEPLLRAVRLRSSLVKRRTATAQRLDALVELLGPAWADIVGSCDYTKSALAVLERYADPRALRKLGRKRLSTLLIRVSRGGVAGVQSRRAARRRRGVDRVVGRRRTRFRGAGRRHRHRGSPAGQPQQVLRRGSVQDPERSWVGEAMDPARRPRFGGRRLQPGSEPVERPPLRR